MYLDLAGNSAALKTGYNAPISTHVGGGNAIVSHHVFSQLVLCALLWLVVLVHLTRPKRPVTAPATPTEEPEPLKPRAFNIVIAGRAAGTPTPDSHSCIQHLPAVSLRDRVKVGRGNLYPHVERAVPKGSSTACITFT